MSSARAQTSRVLPGTIGPPRAAADARAASSRAVSTGAGPGGWNAATRPAARAAASQQERLRHDVVRRVGAEAPDHVPLDVRRVPAEQHVKVLGLTPRELDHGRVVRVRCGLWPALWCYP